MKIPHLLPLAAIVLLVATGCDKQSPVVAKKIAELEQELGDLKLATERDAIERERVQIEDDRGELARQQGAAAAEQDQAILEREKTLSNREGKLEQFQAALAEKEDDLQQQTQQLSERDRDLAGREALSFEQPAPSEPVADYGMFYDSLALYGSWFETSDYGYVWQPAVVRDSNWRPYSRGRWVCSDRGWTWISEEPFGWATYHYGRWSLLRGRGWVWVPGAEWAPSWVSWRENGSHIGWAPLPPETMAYRGHNWDSSVDVQFGIGALCYNFVEMQYFGSSLYDHCLPVSSNGGYFQLTSNITYIHIVNRQIICGGPKYKDVCKGVGRPLPFYRLEIDQHPRSSRDSLGMRPRIKGDHLVVSAPNMDVAWNDGLKPKRIKDRIETVTVERDGNLGREITDRYRQTREQGRQKSEAAVAELGGVDEFDQRRDEKLQDNRRLADGKGRKELSRDVAKMPERPQREIPNIREPVRVERPTIPDPVNDPVADRVVQQPNDNRPRTKAVDDRRIYKAQETPRGAPTEVPQRPQRQVADSRVIQTDEAPEPQETRREQQRQADPAPRIQQGANDRSQDEQAREMQRQAKQNEAQQEAVNRKQVEQAQQRQAEKQRDAEQAREAQKEAAQQQRQQQENAQQREQQRAQRQQQEDQQRDTQRQQERAQQRQQEDAQQRQEDNARQRQQEDNQRQQDNARQRQQEENNQRQRQQEDSQRQRQQDDSRQKQEKEQKDNDDSRKRGR